MTSHPPRGGNFDDHITTRLLVVAAMLEKAVVEVNATMAAIRGELDGEFPDDEDNQERS